MPHAIDTRQPTLSASLSRLLDRLAVSVRSLAARRDPIAGWPWLPKTERCVFEWLKASRRRRVRNVSVYRQHTSTPQSPNVRHLPLPHGRLPPDTFHTKYYGGYAHNSSITLNQPLTSIITLIPDLTPNPTLTSSPNLQHNHNPNTASKPQPYNSKP